jgi:transcriptional regulator with XRE-family HTH domain
VRGGMFDFSVLRGLRKRKGMTIAEVSQRSGVSAAVISKLERNQTQAGLETLFKISRAFEMSATDLVAMAESPLSHRKLESAHEEGPFSLRRVSYGNATLFYGKGGAGQSLSRPEIHKDDTEICWVLSGKIRLSLPEEEHELSAGEAIQFDAMFEHAYEVVESCELIISHVTKEKRF